MIESSRPQLSFAEGLIEEEVGALGTARVVDQAKRFAGDVASGVKHARGILEQINLESCRAALERLIPLMQQASDASNS